jgi:hypothetical protein
MGDWADDEAEGLVRVVRNITVDTEMAQRAVAHKLRECVEAFAAPLRRLVAAQGRLVAAQGRLVAAQGRDILAKQRRIEKLLIRESPLVEWDQETGKVKPVPQGTFLGYIITCNNCGQQYIDAEQSGYCSACSKAVGIKS